MTETQNLVLFKFIKTLQTNKILEILYTINKNYPDKFNSKNIQKELKYIQQHIKHQQLPKIVYNNHKHLINTNTNTIQSGIILKTPKKQRIKKKINESQLCSARVWGKIYDKTSPTPKPITQILDKFKVVDFANINLKEFNAKYILGSRCTRKKISLATESIPSSGKYCKLHSKHLIHGDYLENPNKELCFHYMKDNKLL